MWREVRATKARGVEGTVIWSHQSLSKASAGVFGWHLVGHFSIALFTAFNQRPNGGRGGYLRYAPVRLFHRVMVILWDMSYDSP